MVHHGLPDGGDDLAAQDDVVLHGGIAQIQIAVLQAGRLIGLPAAVDLKGQAVVAAAAQYLDLVGDHFDFTGGLLGVLAGALPHHALHGDGGLLVHVPDGGHHVLALDDDLGGAVEVPQHHEGEVAAHGADVLHPAHQLHLLAHVSKTQLVAGMCTHLHHNSVSPCRKVILFSIIKLIKYKKYLRNYFSRITQPAFLAARPSRMRARVSSRVAVVCSPVAISLQVTTPPAISSSPRNTT